MPWNLTSDRPIFMQIIEIIQLEIISGKYRPGDKRHLCVILHPSSRQSQHDAESTIRIRTQRTCLFPADERTLYYGGCENDRRIKIISCKRENP